MSQSESTKTVAVPYYGSLSMPPLGLSRVFFAATVDPVTRKVARMEIQVWDPKKEPNLFVWMRKQGFGGLICSDSGAHYREALQAEGIWLIAEQDGEALDLVERWLAGALKETESSDSRSRDDASNKWWRRPDEAVLAV